MGGAAAVAAAEAVSVISHAWNGGTMPDTPLFVLTPAEAATLAAARAVLKELEHRTSTATFDISDTWRACGLGRVAEAACVAEETVFNVLNTAHVYVGCRVSANGIDAFAGREARYVGADLRPAGEVHDEEVAALAAGDDGADS